MENKSAGSVFLKVCGILMIIGSILGLIFAIIAIGLLRQNVAGLNTTVHWISVILAVIGCVIELIAGIMGVKYANRPEKARTCMLCGLLVILTSVLSQIIAVIAGGEFSVVSALTGLLVPILYVFGAFKNQKG